MEGLDHERHGVGRRWRPAWVPSAGLGDYMDGRAPPGLGNAKGGGGLGEDAEIILGKVGTESTP